MEIELSTIADAPLLPDIEHSSGEAFRSLPDLAWIADDDVQSVERHIELIETGLAWVARVNGNIVGFLNAEKHDDYLHIFQMAVHSKFQKKGIGRKLIQTVKREAALAGCKRLTLTTFRNVAWNEQFYVSCGFRTLPPSELNDRLKAILVEEGNAGLPLDRRCAMSCTAGEEAKLDLLR